MKSKLLQKISYGVDQSREVVDGQQENDSSRPTKGHETPRNPMNPAVDSQVRDVLPGLLKRNYPPARSWTSCCKHCRKSTLRPTCTCAIPQHLEELHSTHGKANLHVPDVFCIGRNNRRGHNYLGVCT
jgi:hypothetical protein